MMSSYKELTDCLYYPNCTNSFCKYRHIQRTREIFSVDCEKWLLYQCFDKNCLYLHRRAVAAEDSGVVLCKYNSVGCKRDDCPYLHVRSKSSESPRDAVSPRDSSQKSESPRDSSQNEVTQESADDKKRKASAILNKYAYKQKKNETTVENENSKREVVTDGALSSPRTFGGDGAHKKKVISSESDLSGDKEGSSSD